MTSSLPVTDKSEICQILTCLPEKFVVDFANGIDVARDHIRVQKNRDKFFSRLYDGFTGQGVRRQAEINASLTDGVEASLKWLNELSLSVAKSNLAIVQVSNRVAMIQGSLINLANYSADTRQQLINLSMSLTIRCDDIAQEIARIDLVQCANIHLDMVFSKWEAGKFNSFSLSGRCYAALEELRWGDFGDFCRKSNLKNRTTHLEILKNRAISQLAKDAFNAPTTRIDVHQWLIPPTGRHILPDATYALTYMGDWSESNTEPFVFATSHLPEDLPLLLPKICSAERITSALVAEVFVEC